MRVAAGSFAKSCCGRSFGVYRGVPSAGKIESLPLQDWIGPATQTHITLVRDDNPKSPKTKRDLKNIHCVVPMMDLHAPPI